jgi:hypothetical protein
MRIWESCQGPQQLKTIMHRPWRVVESQHLSSSRDLVDNKVEHDLLEDMLEASKPAIVHHSHYLIFTAFRYPPLKYGSRFATSIEPSLWYGSLELETALAEVAYYRLKFFADTSANLAYVEIPMTAFQTFIQTNKGINLCAQPFDRFRSNISHQEDYGVSQKLGADMRAAGVKAFLFYSARSLRLGKNIGIFYPDIFLKRKGEDVFSMQSWRCVSNQNLIEFSRCDFTKIQTFSFSRTDFFHEQPQTGGCILA